MAAGPDVRGVYEGIIDAVSARDVVALESLIAADLIDHMPVPGQPAGRAGFIFWMHSMHAAAPDMTGVVHDTVLEGDRVAGRVLWTGTHTGEFLGLPGTGKPMTITAMHLVRFRDGMAAEWWGAADLLGVAMSLNARLQPPL